MWATAKKNYWHCCLPCRKMVSIVGNKAENSRIQTSPQLWNHQFFLHFRVSIRGIGWRVSGRKVKVTNLSWDCPFQGDSNAFKSKCDSALSHLYLRCLCTAPSRHHRWLSSCWKQATKSLFRNQTSWCNYCSWLRLAGDTCWGARPPWCSWGRRGSCSAPWPRCSSRTWTPGRKQWRATWIFFPLLKLFPMAFF